MVRNLHHQLFVRIHTYYFVSKKRLLKVINQLNQYSSFGNYQNKFRNTCDLLKTSF